MPWRGRHERRLALYRFAPANFAYGRAYVEGFGEGVLERCTPAQAAMLQAPFAPRLSRTLVDADDPTRVHVKERAEAKRKLDEQTFGTKTF